MKRYQVITTSETIRETMPRYGQWVWHGALNYRAMQKLIDFIHFNFNASRSGRLSRNETFAEHIINFSIQIC